MTTNILRLKELLKEKGITGKNLSEMINVSEMTVSNIIQGKTFPKPDTLTEIAKILNVDVRELIEPTKSNNLITLYFKDNTGTFQELGVFDIDKLKDLLK